jgi:hypothetical protein
MHTLAFCSSIASNKLLNDNGMIPGFEGSPNTV